MIPDFPGGLAPQKVLASLCCFFFGGHLFPASPPPLGIPQGESLSLELALDCPSGHPWSRRQGLEFSFPAGCAPGLEAALPPSSSSLPIPSGSLGAEGIGWEDFWEEPGLAGLSLPFPARQERTAESPGAFSEHCLQHLLPRQAQSFASVQVFLKPNTNQVSSFAQPGPAPPPPPEGEGELPFSC